LLDARGLQHQRGVVLVIALSLLVVISLLAITSMRNAGSSESVLGNVRTTELATQAAEIALRHCKLSVLKVQNNAKGDITSAEASYDTTFNAVNILEASTPPHWQDTSGNWDKAPTMAYVLPLSLVNQAGGAIVATYQRAPECMVEKLDLSGDTDFYVVTARGFGPEVAKASGERPVGTEVWLQSHIDLGYKN
jgi:Tfp pilus assembly protein PilX